MRSYQQLKAWEKIVISSDDEEALLRQITVSDESAEHEVSRELSVGFLILERERKGA